MFSFFGFRDEINENRTFFCSELVAAAYKHCGLLSDDVCTASCYPGHFGSDAQLALKHNAKLGPELDVTDYLDGYDKKRTYVYYSKNEIKTYQKRERQQLERKVNFDSDGEADENNYYSPRSKAVCEHFSEDETFVDDSVSYGEEADTDSFRGEDEDQDLKDDGFMRSISVPVALASAVAVKLDDSQLSQLSYQLDNSSQLSDAKTNSSLSILESPLSIASPVSDLRRPSTSSVNRSPPRPNTLTPRHYSYTPRNRNRVPLTPGSQMRRKAYTPRTSHQVRREEFQGHHERQRYMHTPRSSSSTSNLKKNEGKGTI